MTLGAPSEIIRVDSDAMSSDKTRTERQEIPLCPGSLQHIKGVYSHLVEYFGELINKGNVIRREAYYGK